MESQPDRYPRNKATIQQSGIDPELKQLFKLHAIRSNQQKKLKAAQAALEKAQRSVDFYWERVFEARDEQEGYKTA